MVQYKHAICRRTKRLINMEAKGFCRVWNQPPGGSKAGLTTLFKRVAIFLSQLLGLKRPKTLKI